jgi:purine-binding chemotaxis protein CheW
LASTERTPDAGGAAARTPPALASSNGAGRGAPAPAPGAGAAVRRLLLFAVRGRLYGCHIEAVREIVPFRPCTRLPGAPPYVCGLINLRGTIVTVLDLGVRLGGEAVDRSEGSIILVEHGSRVTGLGVDELRDVHHVDYEPSAANTAASPAVTATGAELSRDGGPGAGFILGLGHVGGEVVVVLDVQGIVKQALL